MEHRAGSQVIKGDVPLAEMFWLRDPYAFLDAGPRRVLNAFRAL